MDLQKYGYKPSKKVKCRRRCLKKAIQDNNFDTVYEEIESLKEEKEGYKKDRFQYDLNWMKKRSKRYYTEKF